jgi:hypothetical protein
LLLFQLPLFCLYLSVACLSRDLDRERDRDRDLDLDLDVDLRAGGLRVDRERELDLDWTSRCLPPLSLSGPDRLSSNLPFLLLTDRLPLLDRDVTWNRSRNEDICHN